MADETKTQIPKPTRRRGPMGRMGGMGRGENAKDFKGTMRQLLGYIGQHKIAVFAAVAFAVCSVIFNIVGPKVLGQVTTKLFEGLVAKVNGTGDVDFAWIAKTLGFLLCLYLASSVCSLIQGWLMTGVTQKICYRMRKEIAAKIAVVPMSYFNGHSKGDVLSRITNDVDAIGQTLGQSVGSLITSITLFFGALIMMFYNNVIMTLCAIGSALLGLIIMGVIMKVSQKYFTRQQIALGDVNGHVEEMYTGHTLIKVFDHEKQAIDEFDDINVSLAKAGYKAQFISGIIGPIMNFVSNIAYVLICVIGSVYVLKGTFTLGDITTFFTYSKLFMQPLVSIGNIANNLQSSLASAERVFKLLDEPDECADCYDTRIEEPRGEVEFRDVCFSYSPDAPLIENMNLKVEPGQLVAIVGPTGAGKTTFVNLLMRFYDVNRGEILLDGHDIRSIPRENLRSVFGMVLQDTWLFEGTIMENIAYGRKGCSREEVIGAAKAARVHHFISTLPDGYETMLEENGENISQGQRQLLTIARAILANPSVLILDEATSSVDTRTEVHIQKAMNALMNGRTSFVIAHRLSTIRDADVILVMNDGTIVEQGTHEQLLAANGFYRELYASQFGV